MSAARAVSQAKKMLAFGNAAGGKKEKKTPSRVPDSPTEAMDLVTETRSQTFAVAISSLPPLKFMLTQCELCAPEVSKCAK